jgi:hypothetical protein
MVETRRTKYAYTYYAEDGRVERGELTMDAPASEADADREVRRQLKPLYFKTCTIERVAVIANDERVDMYVCELGAIKRMQCNDVATKLFRDTVLMGTPSKEPEMLPHIAGPVVVFDRVIWTRAATRRAKEDKHGRRQRNRRRSNRAVA